MYCGKFHCIMSVQVPVSLFVVIFLCYILLNKDGIKIVVLK